MESFEDTIGVIRIVIGVALVCFFVFAFISLSVQDHYVAKKKYTEPDDDEAQATMAGSGVKGFFKKIRLFFNEPGAPFWLKFWRALFLLSVAAVFLACGSLMVVVPQWVLQKNIHPNPWLQVINLVWAVLVEISFVQVIVRFRSVRTKGKRGYGHRVEAWKAPSYWLAIFNAAAFVILLFANMVFNAYLDQISDPNELLVALISVIVEQMLVLLPVLLTYGIRCYDWWPWRRTDFRHDARWFDRATVYLVMSSLANVVIVFSTVSGIPQFFSVVPGALFSFGVVAFINHLWNERICPATPAPTDESGCRRRIRP